MQIGKFLESILELSYTQDNPTSKKYTVQITLHRVTR